MTRLKNGLPGRLFKNEAGASSVEYGLIAAFIALSLVGGALSVSGTLVDGFMGIGAKVQDSKDGSFDG